MKVFIIALAVFTTLAHALSKNEIEAIRKELNSELTQLEDATSKRSDNNEVASVEKNDAADILKQIGAAQVDNDSKDLDSLWQKMVEQRKSSDSLSSTKRTAENDDLAKLFEDNTKKSSTDELDALIKLISANDEKSSKRSAESKKSEEDVCKDKRDDCKAYKIFCTDPHYGKNFKDLCPVTCGVCEQCKQDKWAQSTCDNVVKHGLCDVDKYKDRLKENCYESCGYCRAPSPPACSLDPQGCCWDGTTFVKDGCHPCLDASNVARLCPRLQMECSNKYEPGKWMKRNCPVTCKFCDPEKECHDFKQYIKQCSIWRDEGRCNDDTAVQKICRKTCNLCNINSNTK